MAKGRKTGGRKKGTPNKVNALAHMAFLAAFQRRIDDLDRWIRETGDGFEAVHFLSDGTKIPYLERNPAKAAEILTRLAEYHFPRKAAVALTDSDGGPVRVVFKIEE